MRRLLSVSALLLAAAAVASAGHSMAPASQYLKTLAASSCSTSGQYICSAACDQVLLCVANGEDGFQTVVLEQCTGSSWCNAQQHACVTSGSACGTSTAEGIACHSRGLFPDPYNCTIYHICVAVNTQSLPMPCDDGWAYNSQTSDCSKPLTDPACIDGPVDTCLSVGQSGTVGGNPSIYYICVSRNGALIPDLYKCAHGQEYDPGSYACVNSTNPPTTTAAPATTPPPAPPTTSPPDPSVPTPGGWCPEKLKVVPDPEDCTRYYECSPYHKWLHVACTIGFYFNPVHGRCELGFC